MIPGAFGSALRDRRTRKEIWPSSDSQLLIGDYRALELPIDHGTLEPVAAGFEAHAVFREGLGRDFYGHMLDTLENVGCYIRCGATRKPIPGKRNLYVYLYDFRLDNVIAVRGLEALIEQIRADYGDSRLKVDILAHSNGGLLARYYARYGSADLPLSGEFRPTYTGAQAIRRLLLVGTPNLGTLQPVLSHLRGEEIGLRRIPAEVIATCPGAAQLMPHPSVPWLVDPNGQVLWRDLFDIDTWRDFEWSLFDPRIAVRTIERHGGGVEGRRYLDVLRAYMAKHLVRGRRFAESLAVAPRPEDVQPYVFGGDCELTLARLVAESVHGRVHAREATAEIETPTLGVDYEAIMFEPGDSVVTRSSLLGRRDLNVASPRGPDESLRVTHSVFLCEKHQQLTGNRNFQDNLLNALFSVDPV
jgi:pimeloyl-ACP methyl ester carboxylesterase